MIDAAIFLILFLAFTDNLFQEMTGIFGPVTIGMAAGRIAKKDLQFCTAALKFCEIPVKKP